MVFDPPMALGIRDSKTRNLLKVNQITAALDAAMGDPLFDSTVIFRG